MLKNVLELQSRQLVIVEKAVGDGERHPDLDASFTNTMTVNLTFFVEVFKALLASKSHQIALSLLLQVIT